MEKYENENQCQHSGCRCERPSASDYCSDYCENAGTGGMDEDCGCGHPACQ